MTNSTQIEWAKDELKTNGQVSRNQALRRYISRLGAIIFTLKKEGWIIDGKWIERNGGKDFVYTLIKAPDPEQSTLL